GIWNVPEWRATRAARARRRPYIVSPRGMLQNGSLKHHARRKRLAFDLIESSALAHASCLHATSHDEARELRALGFDVPVVTVPNGVDVAIASQARGGSRARLGIAADAFVVLFLGRVHPIKRLDLLADAFVRLHGVCPRAHLVIAGPDEVGHRAAI